MIVGITGSSGSMGKETLKYVMELKEVSLVKLLLLDEGKERRYYRKMKRLYKDRLAVIFGDVRNYQDCLELSKDTDYVLHLAAVIPPKADHDDELTITTNYNGTRNMVEAVIENGNKAKFIHISTVALYGNRNELHPYGRVGDPLLTSAFDVYGTSKLRAERYLLESKLKTWVVLRQTGILYDNLLMNNISDGLMFHTPWNVPIEWVSAKDSGILMRNILKKDMAHDCDDFWHNLYNIGGGEKARETGYETFDRGFKIIGGSVKAFFNPNWNAYKNFHCFWFSDSDKLEEMFKFRTEGNKQFWEWFLSKHRIYTLGKLVPPALIKNIVIKPLLHNNNAPMYWKKHNLKARTYAIYGDKEITDNWDDFDLLCESSEYQKLKKYEPHYDLDHGYDESKARLELADLASAALFRGGKLISTEFSGDMLEKVEWECFCGHIFKASPTTILKAGHWCPKCSLPDRSWQFDLLAKKSPFMAQVWYDTHNKDEQIVYTLDENGPKMEKSY